MSTNTKQIMTTTSINEEIKEDNISTINQLSNVETKEENISTEEKLENIIVENNIEDTLTTDEVKEYSKMILKKFDDLKQNLLLITSINHIDNLPVSVYIKRRFDNNKKKTTKYTLDINLNFETNGLYDYNDDDDVVKVYQKNLLCQTKSSENKNMETCVKTLIYLSQSLKFDNYQSKFIEDSESRYYALERKAFKNNLNDQECSICYDSTTSTTLCDHPICVKCFYNLRKKNEVVKCPICRKVFGDDYIESDDDYYNINDDDDDDDDHDDHEQDDHSDNEPSVTQWTGETIFQHVMENRLN